MHTWNLGNSDAHVELGVSKGCPISFGVEDSPEIMTTLVHTPEPGKLGHGHL